MSPNTSDIETAIIIFQKLFIINIDTLERP